MDEALLGSCLMNLQYRYDGQISMALCNLSSETQWLPKMRQVERGMSIVDGKNMVPSSNW